MTARDIPQVRRELRRTQEARAGVAAQRAAVEFQLQVALERPAPFYHEGEVRSHRVAIARCDERLRELDDRLAALERQLPTAEERAAAARQCETLRQEARQAATDFATATKAYVHAVAEAERAARALAAARVATRTVLATLAATLAIADLHESVPDGPVVDPPLAKVLQLSAMMIGDIAYGDPDSVVELNLNAARAAVDAQPQAV
jgi:chromosome segregation ATPase